jgi:hypothetical protein
VIAAPTTDAWQPDSEGAGGDRHTAPAGQSQPLCDLYVDVLRSMLLAADKRIADLERRLAGQPVTQVWIDGILQQPA